MLEENVFEVLKKAVDKRIVAEAGLAGHAARASPTFTGMEFVGSETRGLAAEAPVVLPAASRARVSDSDGDHKVYRFGH